MYRVSYRIFLVGGGNVSKCLPIPPPPGKKNKNKNKTKQKKNNLFERLLRLYFRPILTKISADRFVVEKYISAK